MWRVLYLPDQERLAYVMSESSKTKARPIVAELGGKNATIVTDTANLDIAAEGIAKAAFSFSGQKCSACSRFLFKEC